MYYTLWRILYRLVYHCTVGTLLYGWVQYCRDWNNTAQFGTILYRLVKYCIVWYTTVQYFIILEGTAQYTLLHYGHDIERRQYRSIVVYCVTDKVQC